MLLFHPLLIHLVSVSCSGVLFPILNAFVQIITDKSSIVADGTLCNVLSYGPRYGTVNHVVRGYLPTVTSVPRPRK